MAAASPERLAAMALRELKALRDPRRAEGTRAYFKSYDGLEFFGIPAPEVGRLAGGIARENREWDLRDAVRFADALIVRPQLEAKTLGISVLGRFHRRFDESLLPVAKRWLTHWCHDWASTDTLCGGVLGPLLADRPDLIPRLRPWRSSSALYVRRAAAVALVPLARRGTAIDEAYDAALALAADREDLIQKATGWLLREAGKTDAARLEVFIKRSGYLFGRTTVRYAIERFEPARRNNLMEASKRRPDRAPTRLSVRQTRRAPARSG